MVPVSTYIEVDPQGVTWLTDTNVKVIEVVLDKVAYGWSPEETHFQHPGISLAQIHAALSHYYENKIRMDAEIDQQRQEVGRLAAAQRESPFYKKLLALKERVSVALYMDVHVPGAISNALRLRGVDVLTADEDHAGRLPDSQLLDRPGARSRVLFSQDADLLREASARQRSGVTFSGLIYAHQLNATIGQCVEDLELIAKAFDPSDVSAAIRRPLLRWRRLGCLLRGSGG